MGKYVFVVDDDPAVLRLSALILKLDGHRIDAFSSALEALRCLEDASAEHPEVIVLDMSMPGMSGREFYYAARGAGYSNSVVVVSAFGAVTAMGELGAEASLAKPFKPEDLSEIVRTVS